MKLTPRPYQQEAIDSLLSDARKHPRENLLVAMPTGTGKSLVIAGLSKAVADRGGRVLVLHRSKELVSQNYERFCQVDPQGVQRAGVYSAGLKIRQVNEQVTFAGVQSVYKRAGEFGRIDAVVVDEAHQIPFSENSQYQTLIKGLRSINPECRFFGLTATPYRTNGVIHGSEQSLFDRMSYVTQLGRMFDEGYLTRPVTLPTDQVDLSRVKVTAGEYNKSEHQSAFLKYWENGSKTAEIIQTANKANRRSIAVFCSGVAHANLVHQELIAAGEKAEVVTGESLPLLRAAAIDDFSARKVRWIVNVDCLTTGWDAPCTDCIVVARGTQSPGLFMQIIGRGTRLYEGKTECNIVDMGGNIERFGPIDSETYGEGFIKEPTDGTGEAPKRVCPNCFEIFAAGKKVCPKCGITLPEKEKVMLSTKKDITIKPTVHQVLDVQLKRWKGKTVEPKDPTKKPFKKPDTMLVQYRLHVEEDAEIGSRKRWAREWVCLEHEGYARTKACNWWAEHSDTEPPETIQEALALFDAGMIGKITEITIKPDGKFEKIVGRKVDKPVPESKLEVDFDDSDLPF